jgi:ubiquinol-cytochrome c reductase cytochrome c subunit
MPLAEPTAEPERKPAKFDRTEVLEIVRYVTSLAPSFDNPGIPVGLDISHANVAVGFSLFALNCAPCHTITGAGDALADGIQAPPLHGVTKTMVWEAVRTGPGNMPRFGPGTLSGAQVDDIVGYVVKNIQHPVSPGGLSLGGVGPVAEGFVGLFVGVGACLLAALWVGDRTETDEDGGQDGQEGHDGPESPDGHEHGPGGDDHSELAHA